MGSFLIPYGYIGGPSSALSLYANPLAPAIALLPAQELLSLLCLSHQCGSALTVVTLCRAYNLMGT